jgi:DNA polymerase/3'-5' exonuclease PolX
MDNRAIAQRLTDRAHILESRKESLFRIMAYRRAAETILGLDEPVENIVARLGRKGLLSLPGIGRHLSYTIESLVKGQTSNVKCECDV